MRKHAEPLSWKEMPQIPCCFCYLVKPRGSFNSLQQSCQARSVCRFAHVYAYVFTLCGRRKKGKDDVRETGEVIERDQEEGTGVKREERAPRRVILLHSDRRAKTNFLTRAAMHLAPAVQDLTPTTLAHTLMPLLHLHYPGPRPYTSTIQNLTGIMQTKTVEDVKVRTRQKLPWAWAKQQQL